MSVDSAREAARHFACEGEVREVLPHGSGHIHDTFRVSAGRTYILQRINPRVINDPVAHVRHVRKVLDFMRRSVADPRRRLTAVAASDGGDCWQDGRGACWRAFDFIEGTMTLDIVETPEQAYEAAKAFGGFVAALADLPAGDLAVPLPDFHNTPKRFLQLESALGEDTLGRASRAEAEIAFALSRRELTGVLSGFFARGEIPERVVHNDTKVNNVLFDAKTGEGLCVVDLDTVMPGLVLHDFGDLVRSAVSDTVEDEPDLEKIAVRMPVFEALARGYSESAEGLLNVLERDHMVFAAKLITYELGMRFLTDYLTGDVYFHTQREGQNLDRARAQFALVRDIEMKEREMDRIVSRLG